jgi:uncharacterized repeat protein (TIGR01451 family)
MGAFESQGFTLTPNQGSNQNTLISTTFPSPLEVSVSPTAPSTDPVDGGVITYTAPSSGAAALGGTPGTTCAAVIYSGKASVSVSANSSTGNYTVTANTVGASAPAAFNLTNGVPDLAVSMSEASEFKSGQQGTYTISVSNLGSSRTDGTTTLVDTLPAGITAVSFSGSGWTCNLATLTATRSDALAAGASYPTITLTVQLSVPEGTNIVNTAAVSDSNDIVMTNNIASSTVTIAAPVDSSISPVSASFDKYTASSGYQDITVSLTLNGNTLNAIRNGGYTLVENTDYTLTGGTVTLKKSYLSTLSNGTASIVFSFSSGSNKTLSISVSNSTPSYGGGGGAIIIGNPVNSSNGSASVMPMFGGNISLGTEASVSIPANALQGSSTVTLAIHRTDDHPPLPSGSIKVGSAYSFTVDEKESFTFDKPVSITFSFERDKVPTGLIPSIFYYDIASSEWVKLGGTVSGSTITVTVNHFTLFTVMAGSENGTQDADQPGTDQGLSPSFNDIEGNWAKDAIVKLAGSGIIKGYADGKFKPDAAITRAEFVTFLVRTLNLKSTTGKIFSDTTDHWARDSISAAYDAGIITGFNDGSFGTEKTLTREEMAVMVTRALKLAPGKHVVFTDHDSISIWALDSVSTICSSGMMKGYPDGTFCPKKKTSRAEACSLLAALLK